MTKTKIKEISECILQTMNETRDKKAFIQDVTTLGNEISKFIEVQEGNFIPEKNDSFFMYAKQDLERLNYRCKVIKQDPRAGICEKISMAANAIKQKIDAEGLGCVIEFYINESGTADIKIALHLSCNYGFGDKKASKEIKFKKKIEMLKSKGYDLKEKRGSQFCFVLNENNLRLIKNTLTNMGAMGISFTTAKDIINSVKFRIKADSIKLIAVKDNTELFTVSDVINQDEEKYLFECLKHICGAMDQFDILPNIKNNLSYIMVSYYSDICKTIGIETELTKEYEKSFIETRKINQMIKQKREILRKYCGEVSIKDELSSIYEKLCSWFSENLSFDVSQFKMSEFGDLIIDLYYETENFSIMGYKILEESKIKEEYETTEGNKENEDLYIKDTDKNKKKINEVIQKFFKNTVYINSVTSEDHFGMVIKKISIVVNDFYKMIQILDQYECLEIE